LWRESAISSTAATPAAGPSAIANAIARLSATTGEGFVASSSSYNSTTLRQSVSSNDGAVAWHAAIAASV
jgi:hypothetical protein